MSRQCAWLSGWRLTPRRDNVRGFVVHVSGDTVRVGLGRRSDAPPRAGVQQTQSFSIDEQTTFEKWINHQPWAQSTAATRAMLMVGRCVDVTLRDNAGVAKIVRISVEPPASLWDPCK